MPMTHYPDRWVIIQFESNLYGCVHKVFASWGGGDSSWQLNSGIEKVEIIGDKYKVTGKTGNVYMLQKHYSGVTTSQASRLQGFLDTVNKTEFASAKIIDIEDLRKFDLAWIE
jgi:hypothetical protein